MQSETPRSPQETYTILRIKRKRNEEPLDALGSFQIFILTTRVSLTASYIAVVESRTRRKKTKGGDAAGMNVFQFAETVEQGAWDDEKQKQDLEVRAI